MTAVRGEREAGRRPASPIVEAAAILAAALAVSASVVLVAGGDPFRALAALAEGAFGGPYQVATVLTKTCPVLLTGLSVSLAFRSGFWNIGAEGQFVAGAIAGSALALAAPAVPAPLVLPASLIAAAAAGGLLAWGAALLKSARGAQEVITTILLNFVALHALSYCVTGPLQERARTQPVSDLIPEGARLARLAGSAYPLHAGILVALALAAAAHVLLFRTGLGLEMRAVGLAPEAARHARIPVGSRIAAGALLSGGIAGLAGMVEIAGSLHRLYPTISPGYGYTGIAVALLARNHPLWVVPSALFFGALEAGSTRLEQDAGVAYHLVLVVQATIIGASALLAARRAVAARET